MNFIEVTVVGIKEEKILLETFQKIYAAETFEQFESFFNGGITGVESLAGKSQITPFHHHPYHYPLSPFAQSNTLRR